MLDGLLLLAGMEAIRVGVEDEEGGAVDDDPAMYTVNLAARSGACFVSFDLLHH